MNKYKDIENYLKQSIAKSIAADFDPHLDESADIFLDLARKKIEEKEGSLRTSSTTLLVMRKMLLLHLLDNLDTIYIDATTSSKEENKNIIYFETTNVIKNFAVELAKSSSPKDRICDFLMELLDNYPEPIDDTEYAYDILDFFEKGSDLFRNSRVLDFVTGEPDAYFDTLFFSLKVLATTKDIVPSLRPIKIRNNINKIKSIYLHNQVGLDESGIEDVCWSLDRLKFPPALVAYMRKRLRNQLLETKDNKKTVKDEKQSKYLSDKEYRAMVKEIKKYYDLHSWKLVAEEITSEEREHVASLMYRIGVDQEQLADFLKKSEKVSKTYTYDYFKNNIEEFKFYFGEELNQVFEYMKEIENCTDEEDKEYWIMGINEELAELQYSNKLASYEYERQLLVRKKHEQDE